MAKREPCSLVASLHKDSLGVCLAGFRVSIHTYRDDGKEHGSCCTLIGFILGIYRGQKHDKRLAKTLRVGGN